MPLTDQWLRTHRNIDQTTDTSLVYEPIFRRYGYSTDDYLKSETHYMSEPDQYAKIARKTTRLFERQIKQIDKDVERDDYLASLHLPFVPRAKKVLARFSMDSVYRGRPRVQHNEYLEIYYTDHPSDTTWNGLEMIVREPDTLLRDSLALDSLRLDSLKVDSLKVKPRKVDSLSRTVLPRPRRIPDISEGAEGDAIDHEEEAL